MTPHRSVQWAYTHFTHPLARPFPILYFTRLYHFRQYLDYMMAVWYALSRRTAPCSSEQGNGLEKETVSARWTVEGGSRYQRCGSRQTPGWGLGLSIDGVGLKD
jgi:hypothetical protein